MAITSVGTQAGGATVNSAASATRAFGANVAIGNRVVVIAIKGVATHRAFVASDCTKSAGTATLGTITLDKTVAFDDTGNSGSWFDIGIFSAPVTGAGSCTMAVAGGAATFWDIATDELHSSIGTVNVGVTNGTGASTGAPNTGSVTPGSYDAALMAGMASGSAANPTTITPAVAFTSIFAETNGAASQVGSAIREIISSGSNAASWTAPTTSGWAAAVVAYTEASSTAPTKQFDFPNPTLLTKSGITNRTHLLEAQTQLFGKDTFFRGPGDAPTYDYPNPRGYTFPQENRGYTRAAQTRLIGQDKFFAAAGQVPDYDWPNPLLSRQVLTLRDAAINLLGTTLKPPPASNPFFQADWPLPLRPQQPLDLKTFLSWVMIDDSMPFQAASTPVNPILARRLTESWLQNLLETTLGITVQNPFNLSDWPNPRSSRPSIDLKTFLNQLDPNLLNQDQFFTSPGRGPNYDWPNPAQPRRPVDTLSWLTNLLSSTLGVTVSPFFQTEWPFPRGTAFPIDLRTFINGTDLNLLGQDTFFGGPGQPPSNRDWPNPTRSLRPIDSLTWTYDLLCNTLNVIIYPFKQLDWPLPKGATFPSDLKTYTKGAATQLFGQDTFYGGPGQPLVNLQWPVPKGYIGVIDLRTQTLNLLQSTLTPAPAPPSSGFDVILVEGRMAKHLSGILYVFMD